jgi:ankyrin repeat protein
MPTRCLPDDPSLEHLRKQAKRLRKAVHRGDPDALRQVEDFHPRPDRAMARFALTDAQLVTARSYGFASWAKLTRHLADVTPLIWNPPAAPDPASSVDIFLRLACLTYAGWHRSNPTRALRMLADDPGLARASIYTAAAVGDVEEVRRRLDREPSLVNARGGPLHWEPLLHACYSRLPATSEEHPTLDVVRLLLARGADPNTGFLFSGRYAFTALTGAFGRGEDWANQPPHPECDALARLLLDGGADPNDAQALYNRHFQENDDHLRLLFAYGLGQVKGGPWLKRLDDESSSPAKLLVQQLCWAAMHDFPERVKLLVEHGVDVTLASLRDGRTAYEEALRAGNLSIAEYLLEHGAKRVELDPLETFALACIAGRGDEARARLAQDPSLLERLGHYGRIELLHRAHDARQPAGIRLIVELGVDINGMVPGTGLDRSVLHNAAGWGGLELVRLLLDLGADPALRDPTYHAAPIGWAMHNQQRDVVEYLLQFADVFAAVPCDGVERVADLLRKDPSLARARDDDGDPLVFCLHPEMTRLEEMIQFLVSYGADLNARGRDGKTLLDRALARGWKELADLVRSHGGRTAAELPA